MSLGALTDLLESISPEAAREFGLMNQLFFQDKGSAAVKARTFLELVINKVLEFEKDNINMPSIVYAKLVDKISYLVAEGFVGQDIQLAMNSVRKIGNKAAHDGSDITYPDVFSAHKNAHSVGVWFLELYSKQHFEAPEYEEPKPQSDLNASEIESMVKSYLKENGLIRDQKTEATDKEINQEEISILNKDLPKGESYLIRELKRLQESSKEAVESAGSFSYYKDYLHVKRGPQAQVEKMLERKLDQQGSNLLFICGSVGDGKSHLLAYLRSHRPELIKEYTIINDATESYSPEMNAMETLVKALEGFKDQNLSTSIQKVILAINMGVLHNFVYDPNNAEFKGLASFIENSGLFTPELTPYFTSEHFDLVSFGDYHPYELTAEGPTSDFYSELMNKIFMKSEKNPFYLAHQEDLESGIYTITHYNYELLQNEQIQKSILELVIEIIIKYKLVISARTYLNFIVDIIMPDHPVSIVKMDEYDVLDNMTPNLLFNREDRSVLLKWFHKISPLNRIRSKEIDELIVALHSLHNKQEVIKEYIRDDVANHWFLKFWEGNEQVDHHAFNKISDAIILTAHLQNKDFYDTTRDQDYKLYTHRLYGFNAKDMDSIREIYNETKSVIYQWKGTPKEEYIYISPVHEKYRLAQRMKLSPNIKHIKMQSGEKLEIFKDRINIAFEIGGSVHHLEIDYTLFHLFRRVLDGYRPNRQDEEEMVHFIEFIEKLMRSGEKKDQLLIHYITDNKIFYLSKDEFSGYSFTGGNM
ncbi:DNA phosphorothioation-dependent restriction protein DptF [Paenibacillus sp. FSL M8-0228]|jgi:DNA phosphorothioation-dependent restriction protein DptF|uniref:DNA phosphorothioation-dependent restriction protein DptF n=1 Tax=Paenibacillus TaxID=44249 RepID=UPI00083E2ACD|nr:DNA phosphorothioation-dependent restriction protein DptF [Paenibacillus polymyxa]MBO3284810.1 DNA phosphorothioation-dependent restriction protein DptF [Paenibacillus polymyxa]ODB53770.1 DNA phosphorothioation-dependent restriction protein DptF [Paenibacillus polymyxa]